MADATDKFAKFALLKTFKPSKSLTQREPFRPDHTTLDMKHQLMLGLCLVAFAAQGGNLTQYVNTFIGTGGHGHTFPGATVPNGMIQASPDTRISGWDACGGYHYTDWLINGFTQTHLSGTGCGDYGDILIMPTTGPQNIASVGPEVQNMNYASSFSHEREDASPGYYCVLLDRYGVTAEVTTTPRAAMYRFTYPETNDPGMIIDVDYSLQNQYNSIMDIEVVSDTEIRGTKQTWGWGAWQKVAFVAKFSRPFTYRLVEKNDDKEQLCKALLHFDPMKNGEVLRVKIAISPVDTDGAQRNLQAEIPDWDFDRVRKQADKAWNDYLSRIVVDTSNRDDKTVFYTAMYHAGIAPNLYSDVDGRHRSMDQTTVQGDPDKPMYTVFSTWDTHRALHPLLTIIQPELNNLFIKSLLDKYQEGGILPMWELSGNYTACMPGYHSVSLMADALTKGISDFDPQLAYKAARRSAEYDTTGIHATPGVVRGLMPVSKYWKNKIGYIPCDVEHESVAKGLEYAYDDWCISQLAEAAGDTEGARRYADMAKYYKNYYDLSVGFMRGKDSQGNWRTPFDPQESSHQLNDYTEGTAWQWLWFVPHDIPGQVEMMGGKEKFIERLDSLFMASSELVGNNVSPDIAGLIGQYAHGNEPSHHIAYLYDYVGQPRKTQKLVDQILKEMYHNDPDGLSGNEDCGQMSAWYILSSLGFYQPAAGRPVYAIGRPFFPRATINLPNGKKFQVKVNNFSKSNPYIKSMRLNGKELTEPFITHADIVAGGILEVDME